ncbi:translocation/assembly module TamB domain-containing protein [Portibacter lacus]|nr:translocation/assembly module TamB domain-containing protein [Portibacter lacus]
MANEKVNTDDKKKKSIGFFARSVIVLFMVILFILTFLTSILYVPSIQNYVVDRVAFRVSNNINGEIKVGNVKLNVFKGLVLQDFVILEKISGDTLIAADAVNAGFADNLFSLFNRQANINTVELTGVSLKDEKGTTSAYSKLASIFRNESVGEDTGEKKEPFDINIKQLNLNDFEYQSVDSIKGETRYVFMKRAEITIDSIDIPGQNFNISKFEANAPHFELTFFERSESEYVSSSVSIDDSTFTIPDTFDLVIQEAHLENGIFILQDLNKVPTGIANEFDPAIIEAKEVNLDIKDFYVNSAAEIVAKIEAGSLKSQDEMIVINEFSCDEYRLDQRRMTFQGLNLITNNSHVKDNLIFKFRSIKDFNDFNNRVIMEANITKSKVGINELIYFAPSMKKSDFFFKNQKRQINFDGIVTGRVNSLNASKMKINFGNEIAIKGRMNSRNLEDVEDAILNLGLDEFSMTVATLSEIIPGFNPPPNFYKLGRLNFNGRFDGYIQDFVAFGDLTSDLGKADLDMRLDLKDGAENAQYSGSAVLRAFDLATWSGNTDFGMLEVEATVKNGKGLRLESVNAELAANVNMLEYKGYVYEDFNMEGKFEQNLFDGIFEISDPNIDLDFSGSIDFTDSIPVYDFEAQVNALKLKKLNIIAEDFALEGNLEINANGTDINNAQGTASGTEFILYKNGNEFKLDSFDLRAKGAFPKRRNFVLNSSLADIELNGFFKLEELPDAFISGLKTNYPNFTKRLNHIKYPNPSPGYDFNINMTIKESEDIFEVLLGESIFIQDATVLGRISNIDNRSALDISFPFLEVNGNVFGGIKGDLFAQAEEGKLDLVVEYANINGVDFSPVKIVANAGKEELHFTINSAELIDSFTNITIDGILRNEDDLFNVRFDNTSFDAFGSTWAFNDENNVVFGTEYLQIDNLVLSDGVRALTFDDINNKGVAMNISSLSTSFFNRLFKADFRGDINGSVEVANVFDFKGFNASVSIPKFGFRQHQFGLVNFDASSPSLKEPIEYKLVAYDKDKNLNFSGAYTIADKNNKGKLRINNYPLDLLEYIIDDGISETFGTVDASVSYDGPIGYPEISGKAEVKEGGSKIDYLGTRYKVGKNNIQFSDGYIDFSDGILIDSRGQEAIVQGGLRHEAFRDFSADLRIRSPKFIALNTSKEDNPSYYGFAQGEMDVLFSGPFETILISVNATTGRNTVLNLPVEYTAEEYSTDFIEIINKNAPKKKVSREDINLEGLSLDMNVNVTQDAKVVILFDETAKDILESSGRGAIQLAIDPEGNFEMFGNYEVVSGQYLFTIPSLLVNKSFIIQNGGNIEWTGDPLNANLNIDATYRGLQASLDKFLAEYLPEGNVGLANQAKQRVEVALTMDLGGTMSTPDIDFDISFPNLTGELKPLAEGRLRTLETNQDAYNDIVFGLILLRTFLPPNQVGNSILNSGNLIGTGYSTISEFVSNQFSILLSSIFDEALEGNSYFSGVDVNFAANKNSNVFAQNNNDILPDEYDINLVSSFNEDKWNLQIGGRYVVNSVFLDVGEYFAPDFVVEYYITDDRRLKLNLYARSDYDTTNSRKLQSGIGITYRKEFNNLFDFAREINEVAQKGDAL